MESEGRVGEGAPRRRHHRKVSDPDEFPYGTIQSYKILDLLGEGATAKVFKCVRRNRIYAVKFLRKAKLANNHSLRRMLSNEIQVQNFLKDDPYTLTLKGSFQDHRCIYHVYDYIRGANLQHLITRLSSVRRPVPVIPLVLIKLWTTQLIALLRTLIRHSCTHRDIKADNILIEYGDVKLVDFSSSCRESSKFRSARSAADRGDDASDDDDMIGTPSHWSPEVVLHRVYGDQLKTPMICTDIWAVGCVFYHMYVGCLPFHGENSDETLKLTLRYEGDAATLNEAINDSVASDFCSRLLDPDPLRRLQFIRGDPLGHEFFKRMPAYCPPTIDPFSLERSIVAYYGTRGSSSDDEMNANRDEDLSSMELTPNVGEAFRGRLISEDDTVCLTTITEDSQDTRSQVRRDRSNDDFTNEAALISRDPQAYGRRVGDPPTYILEWRQRRKQLDMQDVQDPSAAEHLVCSPPPPVAPVESEKLSEQRKGSECCTHSTSTPLTDSNPAPPEWLVGLSGEAVVGRAMRKIEGLLATKLLVTGDVVSAAEIKLWGAVLARCEAKKGVMHSQRRNSILQDSWAVCCSRVFKAPTVTAPSSEFDLVGYAIVYKNGLLLVTEECGDAHLAYDATARLYYLETSVLAASNVDSTVIVIDATEWVIRLDVGTAPNKHAWLSVL